jgi:hypothetical protein
VESFGLSTLSKDNMLKLSYDLAVGCKYAGNFGLFTQIGAICGNFLSNKIVGLLQSSVGTVFKSLLLNAESDRTNPVTVLNVLTM